jgi:hypothetical protein
VNSRIPTSGLYDGLSREALLAREEALSRFAAWAQMRPSTLEPAAALAAVAGLYDMLPATSRHVALDVSGIMTMHRLLAVGFGRK